MATFFVEVNQPCHLFVIFFQLLLDLVLKCNQTFSGCRSCGQPIANVYDIGKIAGLLHVRKTQVNADAACTEVEKRGESTGMERKID